MIQIKRLVLDVLKPHQPYVSEFARAIAAKAEGSYVKLKVLEMDDKTEINPKQNKDGSIQFETTKGKTYRLIRIWHVKKYNYRFSCLKD